LTVRAVLVGCGSISGAWLDAARQIDDLQLVGLVDLDEAAARRRAAEYALHDAAIGADLRAMLARTGPDAVFDCTVPPAHPGVTLTALAHGCHVLGEKPIAETLDDARRMVAAAAEAGKTYAVIQNRRYDPNIRRLRRFLDSGALGPLTTVTSGFYVGAHFGGFRERMPHVLLLDMAIHTFDAARLLSGSEGSTGADPVSVYCKEWNPAGSWYDRDAAAVAVFELTGGIVYTYHGSWCAEGLNTTWEADWRIVGRRGSATWDGAQGYRAEVVAGASGIRSTYDAIAIPPPNAEDRDRAGGHAGVIREFVRCLREGTTPETVCTDNIKSLAMVFGAIESAQQGRSVAIAW
jgi:predicted dehydrogenase